MSSEKVITRVIRSPYYKMAFVMQHGHLKRLTPDEIGMLNIERALEAGENKVETYDVNKCIYSFETYNHEVVDNIIMPTEDLEEFIKTVYDCITQ